MSSTAASGRTSKDRREKTGSSTAADNLTRSDIQILSSRGYSLAQVVGEGSYAKVYQCRKSEGSNTLFLACKVIDSQKAPTNFVKKFLTREIDILTRIQHPHIIHLFSMLHKGSRYFIFMSQLVIKFSHCPHLVVELHLRRMVSDAPGSEKIPKITVNDVTNRLAEKGDLLEFILKKNHIGEGRARTWTTQLAVALEYLHTMGVVHRDIKTENILITAAFNAKLSDFGFARNIYENGVEVLCATHCGSMPYTAPEVLRGKKYDARKSDMWSLGVVAYVMLNKRLPFNGAGTQEAMVQRQLERKVSFENKDTSPQYRVAVMALLEPDVIKRFGASAFLNTAWVRMDDRLIVRSKHEKEALGRALGHREKILGTTVSIPPTSPLSHSTSAGTKRESTAKESSGSDPLVIRHEQPSSYSSVLRDTTQVQEQDSHGLRQHGMSKKKEAVTSKSSTRHAK